MSKKIREGLLKAIDEDEDLEKFISIEHPKRKKEEVSPDDYKLYFGSSDLSKFQIRTAGGTVALDNGGFLGIGTRLPSAALHLNRTLRVVEVDGYTSDGYASEESDGYTEIVTELDSPSSNNELSIAFNNFGLMGYDINRDSMKIKSVYGKNIVFDAGGAMFDVDNSSERMIITYGGNIGIGTSSPQKRLHIVAESGETPIRVSSLQPGPYSKYLVWDDTTGDVFYSESSSANPNNTWRGIDNEPIDGETSESISSGWAHSHKNTTGNDGHIPKTGSIGEFLAHNGSWVTPPNTTYSVGDGGLTENNFTNALKAKLDGIEDGATAVGEALGVDFNDGAKVRFGDGNDLEVYHNGNNSFVSDQGTGGLYVLSNDAHWKSSDSATSFARFRDNGGVELYQSGNLKLQTVSNGVAITGSINSDGLVGTQQLEGILVRYLSVSSDYTIDTHGSGLNDYVVGVDTTNGKVDITLPSGPAKGRYLIIKDSVGNSESSKIVILPNTASGHTIDGVNQVDLQSDYGSVTIVFDGTDRWMVIGKA